MTGYLLFLYGVIVWIFDQGEIGVGAILTKPDYEEHPCKRDCLQAKVSPMTCSYNFTVELYHTLSRACYNCPYNVTDCFRPHCVPADGVQRVIKVVNRMMPGPAIHVCRGDTIVVNVYNEMNDFEGTAIHWHGVLQHGSPHMDGVALITQCPITPRSSFQYKFKADNSGTHYWHAHSGLQRGDGIFGTLVVRDTKQTVVMETYDHDLPEHAVIVHDWLEQSVESRFAIHHHANGDDNPRSVLINGRGTLVTFNQDEQMNHAMHGDMEGHDMTSHGTMTTTTSTHESHSMGSGASSTDSHSTTMTMTSHGSGHTTSPEEHTSHDGHDYTITTPHSVFRVSTGGRYRFRFISNGILNCPLNVSIDHHTLTVIATDGYDTTPVKVSSFSIFAGERYDVVVTADQPPDNYWIRVQGEGDCVLEDKAASQTAILRYDGASDTKPTSSADNAEDHHIRKHLNPIHKDHSSKTVAEMRSVDDVSLLSDNSRLKKFYLAMDFNMVENYRFVDPEFYPLATMVTLHPGDHAHHMYALQLNHISFIMPHSPPLSQYQDLEEGMFCNETWPEGRDCTQEFCECIHRLLVSPGDIVELVLVAEGRHGEGNHPMHLHGHSFWVLAMEKFNSSTSRSAVERLDKEGGIVRNLKNPPRKDTVMVPDGGYTVIRFKADNPGFWLFHCHVDFHLAMGMALVIQVGDTEQIKATPRGFPRCGNWRYVEEEDEGKKEPLLTCDQSTSMASSLTSSRNLILSTNLMLLCFLYVICSYEALTCT